MLWNKNECSNLDTFSYTILILIIIITKYLKLYSKIKILRYAVMIDDSKFWKTSIGISNCILLIYLFIYVSMTLHISDRTWRQRSLYGDSEQQRLPQELRCDWPEPRGGGGFSFHLTLPSLRPSLLLPSWRTERCGDNRTQERRRQKDARRHINRDTAARRLHGQQTFPPAHLALVCAQTIPCVHQQPGLTGRTSRPPYGNQVKGEYQTNALHLASPDPCQTVNH